jgi:hypothetical protein
VKHLTMSILRCPQHDFYAIAIGSLRISPAKCCGSWSQVVREWKTTKEGLLRDFYRAVAEFEPSPPAATREEKT